MPRGIPNKPRIEIETNDIGTGSPVESDFSTTATADDLENLSMVTSESLDSPILSAHIKELSFNEDKLDIIIGQTTDKNAENPVSSGVNGQIKWFTRGQIYKDVPRKFIASIIKKEVNIATKNYLDEDGLNQTKLVHTPAFKNNVQIVRDPSPLASKWFEWMQRVA